MENKNFNNLVFLLKLFQNRPNHLAKYLLDNNSLTEKFLEKLSKNSRFGELGDESMIDFSRGVYFTDFHQMNRFYNSLISNDGQLVKSGRDTVKEINDKLDECLRLEKYEDAIRIRDYMKKNKIKRESK